MTSNFVYAGLEYAARGIMAAQGLDPSFSGIEFIPRIGGAVLAMNHISYVDFICAGLAARRRGRYVRFMAKRQLFDNAVTGPIMRACGHISVDRAEGTPSYEKAVAAVRGGELVGVYPEATISRSLELKAFKSGAARMAIEANVPIIPVAIWGTQRIWTKGHPKRLGRTNTPISLLVGDPIQPYEPVSTLTECLRRTMQQLLTSIQQDYHHEPGAHWVPARLGGSAPAPADADKMDAKKASQT